MNNDFLKIQAVVMDIDGTLVGSEHIMHEHTRNALIALHEKGLLLGLGSGRRVDENMEAYAKNWDLPFQFDFFIGMNGGQMKITKTGEMVEKYPLDESALHDILEMMAPMDLNPFIYNGNGMLITRVDEETIASCRRNNMEAAVAKEGEMWQKPNAKVCYRVPEERMPEVFAYAKAHPDPRWNAFLTQTTMLEFMDPRVHKALGVETFSEKTGIAMENIMACGDMDNDASMLKACGIGVCLANGNDATKACADYVTEYTVDEDGLGRWMEEHLL